MFDTLSNQGEGHFFLISDHANCQVLARKMKYCIMLNIYQKTKTHEYA